MRTSRHIAQSEYAIAYLNLRAGIVANLVSDFIPREKHQETIESPTRRTAVAFNPKKGADLARAVKQVMPDTIDWVPLENMTGPEISATLREVSVYLDLGGQPGRDRLPREAALAGCPVIVAKRGAGLFLADAPLLDMYKVDVTAASFARDTSLLIADMIADPTAHAAAQSSYRDWVQNDRARFSAEVQSALVAKR